MCMYEMWCVQVLSAKRYDLEGFAEYAHQLRESQEFDKSEADNIDYVLRVHSALLGHGIEVPQDHMVSVCVCIHSGIDSRCCRC